MDLSDIILNPINVINTTDLPANEVGNAILVFNNNLIKYGSIATRHRLTQTLNALGSVTDITDDYAVIKVFLFDRFKSNVLESDGRGASSSQISSYKQVPRAYCDTNADIFEGDFILIGFDTDDSSYDERYRVTEKQAHEVSSAVVFYTLYLIKERV